MAEHRGQVIEIVAGTHVDNSGEFVNIGSRGHHVHQGHQQFWRHVVNHIPTHVFNAVGSMRTARTAHAGDQQYFKTFSRRRGAGMRAIRLYVDVFLCHHRASSSAMRMACSKRAVQS